MPFRRELLRELGTVYGVHAVLAAVLVAILFILHPPNYWRGCIIAVLLGTFLHLITMAVTFFLKARHG